MKSRNLKSGTSSTPGTDPLIQITKEEAVARCDAGAPCHPTLANDIKTAEDEEEARYPRSRIGPKIEPPWSFWEGLAEAYMWMKRKGIKHWSERGRGQ